MYLKFADLDVQGEWVKQHWTDESDVSGLTEKETIVNNIYAIVSWQLNMLVVTNL